MSQTQGFFEVDKRGLARLQERRGKAFIVLELLQNALDEQVSIVDVQLHPVPGRRLVRLQVTDDSPDGFIDLSHAFTLFADSRKRADAGQRGRFNLGEKLVLALCEEATISTTTGTVLFKDDTRKVLPRRRRERGSVFEALVKMNREELAQAHEALAMVLVPAGIQVTVNGQQLSHRDELRCFEAQLPTEVADDDGVMRRRERRTTIRLLSTQGDERPHLYEMGLPLTELPGRWHVDIGQKVPLGMERDSVSSAYLRRVLTEVVGCAHDLLAPEEARADWVGEALGTGRLPSEAVNSIVTGRYGHRRVSYDPSDPEGSKIAVSRGYEVISGGAFTREQWQAIRAADAVKPAGQVTPSPKPYGTSGPVRKDLPEDQVTPGMRAIKALTERLAGRLLPDHVQVEVMFIADRAVRAGATFGPPRDRRPHFEFNVSLLGRRFFDQEPTSPAVLSLVIHELGHWYTGDHLSSKYHDALCDLGARTAALALSDPELFSSVPDELLLSAEA